MLFSVKVSAALILIVRLSVAFAASNAPGGQIDFLDLSQSASSQNMTFTAYGVADRVNGEVQSYAERHDATLSRVRGSTSSSSQQSGSYYEVHKDKGKAASWEWFKREVVLKCLRGPNAGSLPSVYLTDGGNWRGRSRSFSTMEQAGNYVCSE